MYRRVPPTFSHVWYSGSGYTVFGISPWLLAFFYEGSFVRSVD
jgi:hypothetical protein